MKVLVVLAVMASTAYAETAEGLTESARTLAREGRCDELPAIGRRVDKLDDDYYTRVYSLDPVIAGCKQIDLRTLVPGVSLKSPAVALGLSLGLTAAGAGLTFAGSHFDQPTMVGPGALLLLFGPLSGRIYAEDPLNAGMGLQLIGGAVAVLGALSCVDECRGDAATGRTNTLIAGGLIFAAGSVYEIATAPWAADRYNHEHGFEATVVPTGNGLAVVGAF